MSQLAIQLIEEACKKKSPFLDLGNCSLSGIPKEIGTLSDTLEELVLGETYKINETYFTTKNGLSRNFFEDGISTFERLASLKKIKSLWIGFSLGKAGQEGAKAISRLSGLINLDISGNDLDYEGAEMVCQLYGLNNLDISENRIGTRGAEAISQLSRLYGLNVSYNGIGYAGAEAIGRLTGLAILDISGNRLGQAGAEALNRLSGLVRLNISGNGIRPEGAQSLSTLRKLSGLNLKKNFITHLPYDLIENVQLEIDLNDESERFGDKMYLFGNDIESPPQEVLKQGRRAILEYFDAKRKPLNECKLIFIGDGAAGKTSLMKRLVFKSFDYNEKTTHGINKIAWKVVKNSKGQQIKVNLWDFGGQHIQHSLHQFFLTERVVYVLVLNPRNDEKAYYWLDQIEKLGQGSQIIIAYNWKNEKDKEANYLNNFYELRKVYPRLPEPVLLSCASGEGMDEFENKIKEAVLSNEGLKTEYPETWFDIKEKLEREVHVEQNFVEYSVYEKWCKEKNYNDPDSRRSLLKILDSVGSIVFFDRPVLNQLQILNPEWITTGAYAILTSEKTRETKGHLQWKDLQEIFSEEKEIFSDKRVKIKYTENQFKFILQLMLEYRLCQRNPLEEHEYLVPSAFGEKPEKDYDNSRKGSQHYRLQFESPFEMLIMHRFIAENILYITGKDYWNSGMLFKRPDVETYALVETNLYSKQINCWIKGVNVRGFWEVIRNDFRKIFKMYHNFPVSEEVEYSMNGRTVFLPYQEMLDSLRNGVLIISYHPTYQLKNIDVLQVLELFEGPEQTKFALSNERGGLQININNIIPQTKNHNQSLSSEMKKNNPWISGSFYLVITTILLVGLAVIAKNVHWAVLPIIVIGGVLLIGMVGLFQLKNDDKLKDASFQKLLIETYKRLPLLSKQRTK